MTIANEHVTAKFHVHSVKHIHTPPRHAKSMLVLLGTAKAPQVRRRLRYKIIPRENQHWNNQAYPSRTQGKYRFATGNLPRFQPPVVPPLIQPPPYVNQTIPKMKQKSQQDVRDDPRFNEQPQLAAINNIQQSSVQNPETYVKYPIPIGATQNQDNVNPTQQTQLQQADKSQHQLQVKKSPKKSTSHNVQEELYLQLIRQQQEQLKTLQEQNQMLRQQQWQQQITKLQNNSQTKEKKECIS